MAANSKTQRQEAGAGVFTPCPIRIRGRSSSEPCISETNVSKGQQHSDTKARLKTQASQWEKFATNVPRGAQMIADSRSLLAEVDAILKHRLPRTAA
jgi:hypothetical protein